MHVSKEQLPLFAGRVIAYAKEHMQHDQATVIALLGDLGAGKTTFVQEIAHSLGVVAMVPSPTFVIMRSYATTDPVFTRLVHIDAYRIDDEHELAPLHLEQVFAEPHTLVCVEWPQKLRGALPAQALTISLTPTGENEREVSTNFDAGFPQEPL